MENNLFITSESNLEDIKVKIASGLVNEIIVEPKGNELFNSCIQSLTDTNHITYITLNTIDKLTLENLLNLVNSNVFINDIHINIPISNQCYDYINNKLANNFSLENFSVRILANLGSDSIHPTVKIKNIEKNNRCFEEFINSKKYYLNQPKLKISDFIYHYYYYNAENYNIRMLSTYLLQQKLKIEEIDFSSDIKNKSYILEFIKYYPNFETLTLKKLDIDDSLVRDLLKSLPKNSSEAMLIDLRHNKLTASIIPDLIAFSLDNKDIIFDIRENNFSYDICLFNSFITEYNHAEIGIANNYTLSSLEGFNLPINTCYIRLDLSFELTAKLVSTKEIVRKLILDPSKISTVDFKELILQHVTNNPILVEFKMPGNKLFIEGIKELTKIINDKACNLTHIDLSTDFEEPGLSNEAVMPLFEKLQDNTKLIALNLNGNPINGGINNTLQGCLKKNKFLTHLDLKFTDIDESSAKSLVQATSKGIQQNRSLISLLISPRISSNKKLQFSKTTIDLLNKFKNQNLDAKAQLTNAIDENNLAKIKSLLEKASLYTSNDEGTYLIFKAIEKGYLDIIKEFVVSRNYNLAILNIYNQTPLEYAESLKNQISEPNNLEEIIKVLTTPELFKNPYNNALKANSNKRKAESEPTTSHSANKKLRLDQAPIAFSQNNNNNNQFIDITNSLDIYTSDEQVTNRNNTNINLTLFPSINNDNVVPNFIPETNNLTNQFDTLVNLICTNNIYYLTNYISTNNIELLLYSVDIFGNNLLHIAVLQGNLNIVNLLLESNFNCNLLNLENLSALELAINILTRYEKNDTQYSNYLKIIYSLIKANSTVIIDLINKAIQLGQYKLFKLLLNSSTCDINKKDIHQKTPIMYILDKQDLPMLDRLLIDRRLSSETINESLFYVRNLANTYQLKYQNDLKIFDILINKLEIRIKSKYPEPKIGLQWVKKFNLFYGSHSEHAQKRLQINSNKQMAYLAEQNILNRALKQASNVDEKNQILVKFGNPVTASLVFIVSSGKYISPHIIKRTKIRIELDFIETHHLYNDETPDALFSVKEKIKQRVAAAPQEAFNTTSIHRNNRSALTEDEIEAKYQNYLNNNNDPSFNQLFHHGEQSLLDDLEQDQTLLHIITRLKQQPKFTEGCKVYGVILEIYSPRYLCENCEVAILGEQNYKKSTFLIKLKQLLTSHGCVLPTLNSLRMITLVGSEIPFSNQVDESEHYDFTIDIRSTNNNMILSRDSNAFNQPSLTQYHSNRLHHT